MGQTRGIFVSEIQAISLSRESDGLYFDSSSYIWVGHSVETFSMPQTKTFLKLGPTEEVKNHADE